MKIGVFGGSFDPPHLGHLAVAQDAMEALELDLLLFVPARVSPFKVEDRGTDPEIRASMVEGALADHPRMRVWRGELSRPAPSYTVDTLEALRSEHPEAELHLLMGSDQWASFRDWKDPERIAGLARVCVLAREGEDGSGTDLVPPHRVPVRRVDVSSTEIRERVAGGRSIRFLVPETVRTVIWENELYGARAGESPAGVA